MNKLLAFLNNMDARAWRTVVVSVALMAVVGTMIVLGKTGVFGVSDDIEALLADLRNGPWGLPATIALFCATAYIAAPQFVLIGACVVAFGPWNGFFYSWIGTIVSGVLTFYTGRWAGADFVRRYGGDTVNRMSRFIGRNDFLASVIVRNVPTAPFIVVNMAFGVSHASFWRYIAGLTVGVIPKTAIVALLGQSALSAVGGAPVLAAGIAFTVLGVWVTVALAARKAVRGEKASDVARED
ncbi:MAG: TVP38/TMEM64 family protein [Alphaproteobacteria bacterium]|nr:TVP38/TMEM64 family protein [Alphaproteobacteria bacterium]